MTPKLTCCSNSRFGAISLATVVHFLLTFSSALFFCAPGLSSGVHTQASAPVNHLLNKICKLAVRQTQPHCVLTFSNPFTVQRRKPCRAFTAANRGSIIEALRLSRALPSSLARVSLICTTTALCGPISIVRPFGSSVHCAITGQSLHRQRYTRMVWPRRSFCPVKTNACF